MEHMLPDQVTAVGAKPAERYKLRARGFFVAALLIGLASSFAAQAAGDDTEDEPFEAKIMKGLLGNDKPVIDYRERSPLVIPPSASLPAPENTSVAPSPAWPKDPDALAAKRAKKVDPRERRLQEERACGMLLPDEVNGRRPTTRAGAGGVGATNSRDNTDGRIGRALSPAELGSKGSIFSNIFSSKEETETAAFPGEPPRASLTDPPTGYMTPSPNYPYGLSPTRTAPKGTNFEDRHIGKD